MNQNPEQIARDEIDKQLEKAGWRVQSKDKIDLTLGMGIAVREYPTYIGNADYVLFIERKPVGIVEAKREDEGYRLTVHEVQAEEYARSQLRHLDNEPLPFIYESTGTLTKFTDDRDPRPRSRTVFGFHQPSTLRDWKSREETLRNKLQKIPKLNEEGLRSAQINAIKNLEQSFKENRPKALIQMATGAGKTFTACTFSYRLLKYANAKRILFLVDTKNLGEQAEQEFIAFQPNDDNRKFTDLYNVQLLKSNFISPDSHICISTIQRLYYILQGKELDEKLEEENPNERSFETKKPMPVVYNSQVPVGQFDFIIIDECHRSIYNIWKQVLDYFDSFIIGLTATPDKRTFGFFNENVVSEYSHEDAVADGVNVTGDIFLIETQITNAGATIEAKEYIEKREKLSRKQRWEQLDEDYDYDSRKLDREVVNTSQIRQIIRKFKEILQTTLFPDRFDQNGEFEVPKTLIFAKTDSHADDIIQIVREEFAEGNDFCKKITYRSEEDPNSILSKFRNNWSPRIAVTVDMIAVGTDVKPLEVLLFMRDVKTLNYFNQMKGRGTRILSIDDLKRVTRTARKAKDHFVIVDAVGVTTSKKTDSRSLERKKSVPLKELLNAVAVGAKNEDLFLSLANRLIRLNIQLDESEKQEIKHLAKGKSLEQINKELLKAYDPDAIEKEAQLLWEEIPEYQRTPEKLDEYKIKAQEKLSDQASSSFNGKLNEYIERVRQIHEQIIDRINQDQVLRAEWQTTPEEAQKIIKDFSEYLKAHKDEIIALSIFYDQPYNRRKITFRMINEIFEKLKNDQPGLAPFRVWNACLQLEEVKEPTPANELVALVSLIRKVTGIDSDLTPYNKTVDKNFQTWVFKKQAGALKFTEEQMAWLRMIKDHITTSFHLEMNDLDYTPFDAKGGHGKMHQLFGEQMTEIVDEINEALVA